MLPVLTYTAPRAAADALRWRHCRRSTWRASGRATLGLKGAAFPWRTIQGEECSGYWPAGTAAFHINADIADAVARYQAAADDAEFEREHRHRAAGRDRAPVAVARPSRRGRAVPHRRRHRARRVQRDRRQQHLHQPDGPAQSARRRRCGRDATRDRGDELGVDAEEAAAWRDAAEADGRSPMTIRPGGPSPGRAVHRPRSSGTSTTPRRRPVPAAAALPLLRPVPQAGRQAGRPRAGAVRVRRRVHRRGEGARLRLLRAADRARLIAVGLHARRSSPPRSVTWTSPTTTSPRRR